MNFLDVFFKKLCEITISLRFSILKMFAQGKDDKKRVESILQSLGFSTGKNDTINPQAFDFETFFNFYVHLTKRTEVERVFNEM